MFSTVSLRPRSAALPALAAALVGLLALGSAQAARLSDLYEVTIPAPEGETREEVQEAAFVRAMDVLLIRVTGRRDAVSNPALDPLRLSASRYVQQWGYRNEEQVLVAFDGAAVERRLANLGASVWGAERPLTMVWIAVDLGGGRRQILAAAEDEQPSDKELDRIDVIRQRVVDAATERGLPIVFPNAEAQEGLGIDFNDIWGGISSSIEAASRPYRADRVLVGRVRSAGGPLIVRWTLISGDEERQRRGTIEDGIDWVADTYAARFAASGGAQRERIAVVNVADFDDYGRLMRFLNTVSILEAVEVSQMEGSTLYLELSARGDRGTLSRAVTLGDVLQPVPPPSVAAAPSAAAASLYFRLVPRR